VICHRVSDKSLLRLSIDIGRRRPDLADATIKVSPRTLARRHLRDAAANQDYQGIVEAQDKLLVFLTRRDVEPTNNESERNLRPSVIFRKVTNCFGSNWGAKVYADLCSIVGTGRLNGRSLFAAIRAALTMRSKLATTS